jgi:hypothetical protein
MKIHRLIKNAAIVLTGLALACSITRTQAQTIITDYTNTFDNDGNTTMYQNNYMYWYSLYQDCFGAGYNINMTNDPSMDADGNTNVSGSLYCYSPFAPRGSIPPNGTAAIPSYGDQSLMSGTFGGGLFDTSVQMKIVTVTNISFKIHVLPGTITDETGNFGTIAVGLKSVGYNADTAYYTNELTIPGAATNGWVTLSETNAQQFQNAGENSGDTYAQGPEFYYTQYNATSYPTNLVVFWIDDLVIQSSVAPPPPPPPPTVSISPAVQGLNLFTGAGNSTALYNRESIESVNPNYSWVGASGPVSYSFTITNYPVGSNDAVQCQIFLIPNPGTETAPDYTESNLVFLDLESDTPNGGGVEWNFRYKTNEPNGNSFVYGAGTLASIGTNTAIGTWTVTFNNNTNVTMTIPGGASTNFNLPDSTGATSALFASGVDLYFGAQAGNAGGVNDHIVASDFSVTGLGSSDFNDNFVADAGILNSSIWETNAAFPSCVQLVGPGNPYWIQWTEPATGYTLETAAALSDDTAWTAVTNNVAFISGTNYTQLVSTNDLQAGNAAFFAVIQHNNQLQVLWPGETAAPGTPTGKTGTPTPVSISTNGGSVTFTVNAVDSKWNLIPTINDTVAIMSSDSAATLPGSSPLTSGTGQFTITFATTNSQTVTATDVTQGNVAPNTSSPILVTP